MKKTDVKPTERPPEKVRIKPDYIDTKQPGVPVETPYKHSDPRRKLLDK